MNNSSATTPALDPQQIRLVDAFMQDLAEMKQHKGEAINTLQQQAIRQIAASPEGIRILAQRELINQHMDEVTKRTGKRPPMPKLETGIPHNEALALRHVTALTYAKFTGEPLGEKFLNNIERNAESKNGTAMLEWLEELETHRYPLVAQPKPRDLSPSKFKRIDQPQTTVTTEGKGR